MSVWEVSTFNQNMMESLIASPDIEDEGCISNSSESERNV